MTALLLDGRVLAKQIKEEIKTDVAALVAQGHQPTLAVIRVEGDAASERYLRMIRKACDEVGMQCVEQVLSSNIDQEMLEAMLQNLSDDPSIDGMLLQVPLPKGLDEQAAVMKIDPEKDVDGVHPYNAGRLVLGQDGFVPNTPAGGMELLRRNGIALKGKHAVVVGRSAIVGKPMALLLLQEHATVTIAHSRTADLGAVIRSADIVAAAAGRAGLITADMIKPGAVVIDFGINVGDDGKVVGDVEYTGAAEVASAITPVPGGTGPVTNVMLLRNVLKVARRTRA